MTLDPWLLSFVCWLLTFDNIENWPLTFYLWHLTFDLWQLSLILNDMSHFYWWILRLSQQSENDCQSVSRNMDLRDASASINCSPSLKNDRRNSGGTLRQKKPRLNLIWVSISISISFNRHPLVSISINQHLLASISTNPYQSESISIHPNQSVSISINHDQSASVSINHHL